MLMSKSRLEKFLYALYSLDSSDLPNPLSRIEELYKCWVTGEEAPTFEPLSRVEKYLMAILGAYNVDELPNPLSRVEVLLHKLATGDDNLDDVESFLSEHEELLAEIIRNGGAGGNIDIEYILYTLSTEHNTLYNTAEKPVKSAILKGMTLVNLVKQNEATAMYTTREAITNGFRYTQQYNNTSMGATRIHWNKETGVNLFKPSTEYYIQCDIKVNKPRVLRVYSPGSNTQFSYEFLENESTHIKGTFVTATNSFDYIYFYVSPVSPLEGSNMEDYVGDTFEITNLIIIEYQEGMENWDIPYFEGMQSVKMPVLKTTGKNLFNINTYTSLKDDATIEGEWLILWGNYQPNSSTWDVTLAPNTTYYVSEFIDSDITTNSSFGRFRVVDKMRNEILQLGGFNRLLTTTNECDYIFEIGRSSGFIGSITKFKIQIEQGTQATSFEPHKSNILTTSEDITLGSVGNVHDTLDLLTGNVISRTKLYTYKGEIEPYFNQTIGGYIANVAMNANVTLKTGIISDKFILGTYTGYDTGVYGNSNGSFYFFDKLVSSAQEFKEKHIGTNFRFRLLEESIKTVDLSVVDQDGNNTELSTFDDLTYVTLSSEGLIPEAELEVATKNEEVLNTMSLEMDDISATQTTLEETSNTQSENVDATMIATTEIYEELL